VVVVERLGGNGGMRAGSVSISASTSTTTLNEYQPPEDAYLISQGLVQKEVQSVAAVPE
jgi:hypothetical protein